MCLQCTGKQVWYKWLWIPLGCSLKAFNTDGWDEYGCILLSGPGAESLCPPFFSESSQKSIQSLLSPQFLSEPCINPAHVLAFLCQAHDWVLKFQILGTAVAWTPTFPTRECLTMLLIFVEPLLAKQLHNPTAVLSLWQQSKKLAPRLTVTSHLPCSYSWEQCSI